MGVVRRWNLIAPLATLLGLLSSAPMISAQQSPDANVSTADDFAALSALYHSTRGVNWQTALNWMTGNPCTSSWFGVACNGTFGTGVTGLYLEQNRLQGSLPRSGASHAFA